VTRRVLALLMMLAAPAHADRARTYFDAGTAAYRAGHYLTAAAAYEEAYRLSPLPALLFSTAQAYRRQYYRDGDHGWLRKSLALYRRYLRDEPRPARLEHAMRHIEAIEAILARAPDGANPAPPPATQIMVVSPTAGARASVDGSAPAPVPVVADVAAGDHVVAVDAPGHQPATSRWLAIDGKLVVAQVALVPRPARLTVRAPAGAAVSVDDRRLGSAPIGPVALAGGSHAVVVTARGRRPFARRIAVAPGEVVALAVELPPTRRRIASTWLLGGAAALLAGGGVTGALAYAAQSDARGALALPDRDLAAYQDALDRRDRLRAVTWALGLSALAVGGTGLVLRWWDNPTAALPDAPPLPIAPLIGPDSIGAAVTVEL
jgi:tetratricopeptide (TPR) repeat protein